MRATDVPRPATPRVYRPWEYFASIFAAVFLAILAADLVRLGVAAIAAKHAQRQAVEQLRSLTRQMDAQADALDAQSSPAALPEYPPPRADAQPDSLACSQGAILRRIDGGWEQVGRSAGRAACRSSSR